MWLRIETRWRSLVNTVMNLQVVLDLDVDVDWRHLAQDYDQWRTLVNKTMNFQFLKKTLDVLTGGRTLSF
jgi:hypothetical protein